METRRNFVIIGLFFCFLGVFALAYTEIENRSVDDAPQVTAADADDVDGGEAGGLGVAQGDEAGGPPRRDDRRTRT